MIPLPPIALAFGATARTPERVAAAVRVGTGLGIIALVQTAICALAALPVALAWHAVLAAVPAPLARALLVALLALPTYGAFAVLLAIVSPVVMRAIVPRTGAGLELRIADAGWPLLHWCHRAVATHLVRMVAGSLFRGSPIWSAHLRLAGARVGRRVYVNSVHLADLELLDLGDDVVIGSDVHLSGHTVERGIVKTAPVRIGAGATIGIGSVIGIGAEVGTGCIVAALSFVPKHATLAPDAVYAGIPASPIQPGRTGQRRSGTR